MPSIGSDTLTEWKIIFLNKIWAKHRELNTLPRRKLVTFLLLTQM